MSLWIGQYFMSADYMLALPMVLLSLFALGILLIDLILPKEWKPANAFVALAGISFSAAAVVNFTWLIEWQSDQPGFVGRSHRFLPDSWVELLRVLSYVS